MRILLLGVGSCTGTHKHSEDVPHKAQQRTLEPHPPSDPHSCSRLLLPLLLLLIPTWHPLQGQARPVTAHLQTFPLDTTDTAQLRLHSHPRHCAIVSSFPPLILILRNRACIPTRDFSASASETAAGHMPFFARMASSPHTCTYACTAACTSAGHSSQGRLSVHHVS